MANSKDSYVLTKENIVMKIHHFEKSVVGSISFVAYEFKIIESVFDYPINSKQLCIFKVSELKRVATIKPINDLVMKFFVYPDHDYFYCILHSYQ